MKIAWLLLLASLSWGQDIVLKASFYSPENPTGFGATVKTLEPLDVNNDGIPEVPGRSGYYDLVTMHFYRFPGPGFNYPQDCYGCQNIYALRMRSFGKAEYCYRYDVNGIMRVVDIETTEVLASFTFHEGPIIGDYDRDGFDDIIIGTDATHYQVYGIAIGNPPISPPQDLDIQQEGQDYIISWSSVPTATAYRVDWSSAIDGQGFTRIGYTTGTTFIHRNQVGQERGFYRVLSEDNGTGVVRMVGSSKQSR